MIPLRPLLLPLASLLALTSCVPLVLVGAAAGGTAVGVDSQKEGGLGQTGDDFRIRAAINDKWYKTDKLTFHKLHLSVNQGRVLITGIVQNPDARVSAVRLVWQVDGVTQVINEIQIADSQSFGSYAQDRWISTRIRTALTFEKDVKSANYSIDTVSGIVYLMGVYQDKEELDDVVGICQDTPHVKQVVSYVKKLGEAIPQGGTGRNATMHSGEDFGATRAPVDDSHEDSRGAMAPASAPPEPLGDVQRDNLQPVQKERLN